MKMKTKFIIGLAIIFLVGTLIYLVYTTKPKQILPLSGMIITEEFAFEFENADQLTISVNKDFSQQIILKKGSKIELPPGTYYWKAKGFFGESEIRNFTILSRVALNLEERNESLILSNVGNVDLNVTKMSEENITYLIIEKTKKKEFEKENTTFEGRQI